MFGATDAAIDLSTVDFSDVDEINDCAYKLINVGNSIGIFLSATPLQSREAMQVYQVARRWVNTVKRQLQIMQSAVAMRLVESYEIMHRLAFNTSAKNEELNGIKLAAFDAMIHGDREVDEYIMFRVIRNAVRQREKVFLDKPLTWSCITEERWFKEAIQGFDHTKLSDYDIISRITILLESDLFAYEGSNRDQFKQTLVNQHRHYLEGYTTPDRRTENALNGFRLLAHRYM